MKEICGYLSIVFFSVGVLQCTLQSEWETVLGCMITGVAALVVSFRRS
ncbi:hypothetical protein [Shimazuella kribbensis]|nr:hypothetical protein [Shimazuella kribbensis]